MFNIVKAPYFCVSLLCRFFAYYFDVVSATVFFSTLFFLEVLNEFCLYFLAGF